MLDKVMIVSKNEVVLIFTNRSPVTITSSEGNAYEVYLWLFTPTAATLTLSEFSSAVMSEDTCPGVAA